MSAKKTEHLTFLLSTIVISIISFLTVTSCNKYQSLALTTQSSNQVNKVDPTDYQGIPAVVLKNDYYISFIKEAVSDQHIQIKQVKQIQLMQPEGLSYAIMKILDEQNTEGLKIEGKIIKPNGKINKISSTLLQKEPFFKNELQDKSLIFKNATYKTLYPFGAIVGDVIEYTVTQSWTDSRWIKPIFVSGILPTIKSEIIIDTPSTISIDFTVAKLGKEIDKQPRKFPINYGSNKHGIRYIFSFKNESPLFPKSHQANIEALATQMYIISYTHGTDKNSSGSFENFTDLIVWFYKEAYKDYYQHDKDIKKQSLELTKNKYTLQDKILAIQQFVQNHILSLKSPPNISSLPNTSPTKVLKSKAGTSKDKSILAKALLDAAGIDNYFVLAANKKTASPLTSLPAPSSFNHVLIAIPVDNKYIFLDPTLIFASLSQVSGYLEEQTVLLIKDDKGILLEIPKILTEENKQNISYNLYLDSNGKINGNFYVSLKGAQASKIRKIFARSQEPIVKTLQNSILLNTPSNIEWESVETQTNDLYFNGAFELKGSIKQTQAAQKTEMSLNLDAIFFIGEIPPYIFDKHRKTPIIFDHIGNQEINITLSLPDNYKVISAPSDIEIKDDDIFIKSSFVAQDDKIYINYVFENKNSTIVMNKKNKQARSFTKKNKTLFTIVKNM